MEMVRRDDLAVCHGTEWGVFMTGGMADDIPASALPLLLQLACREARLASRLITLYVNNHVLRYYVA